MDPRLLRLYNDELTHLRETGSEFAAEFPKIAARLGMEGMEVADPYVERLLEGFAFLAARVQLKLEAEQPRLIAHLLEAIYPNFLAPVPSMLVARFGIDPADPNLVKGYEVPRGSAVLSEFARGQDTHCEFRTAHGVTLWPIELAAVHYFSQAADLPPTRLPQARGARGGLRIRLRCGGGVAFHQLGMDRLAFFISAPDDVAYRLHELVLGAAAGTVVLAGQGDPASQWRGSESVQPLGFSGGEALLPESLRAFSGYRLLQEAAALPQRLLFFEITGLAERLARTTGDELELLVFLQRGDPALEALVDTQSLSLFCTPAINLFHKRLDRIQLGTGSWEYHVVPDRTRPMDYEVHSVASVTGFGTGRVAQQPFLPLYTTWHEGAGGTDGEAPGYFTVRREPRLLSARQKEQGLRSAYIGEEVYLALVDPGHGPYREDVRQLSVTAWVTNRDLPTLLPRAAGNTARAPEWRLESPGPVARVDVLRGPTRPVTRRPVGELGWSLVSHLTLNHLALTAESPQHAAAALRTTLGLYAPPEDTAWARQVQGVQALHARPVVRRLPFPGPLTFGSGVEVALELDDLAFQGGSAFLFASVLERFFARHAAINSFTQLTLRTPQRGEVMRWPPRIGLREVV